MQKIASGNNTNAISKSISSGFKIFDKNMGGWRSGQLIVIGARPGMGKTAFLVSSISNIIKEYKFPLAYFSVEHAPEQTMTRLISKASGISISKLESGKVNEEEMLRIHEASEYISDARLYMLQLNECSLEEVLDNANRLIVEKGIKMLMIDYLQLLNVRSKSFRTRDSEISHITRTLKIFSRENHIPIIITSQLSRDVERRSTFNKRPFLSDLRDSGAIEQDASQIIFIYRPEYYGYVEDEIGNSVKGVANIILAKNDNGICKEFKFRFTGYCCRFEEYEEDSESFLNIRNDDFDDKPPF
jgi:replicative DNA helicase